MEVVTSTNKVIKEPVNARQDDTDLPYHLPLPTFAAIVTISSLLVAGAICIFLWKCLCHEHIKSSKKKKMSTVTGMKQTDRVDFVLPIISPSVYEEKVQVNNECRFPSRRSSLALFSDEEGSEFGADDRPPGPRPLYTGIRRSSLLGRNSSSGIPPGNAMMMMMSRRSSMSAFEIIPDELSPEIYTADEGYNTPSSHSLGKICFSMIYHRDKQLLSVTLIRAIYLCTKSIRETADPYCKVVLLPENKPKYVSKIHRNTLNPVFEETFNFQVTETEIERKVLRITVCDYDRFARQVVLGYVKCPISDVSKDMLSSGTDDIWRNICDDSPDKINRGRLLFSLCFNPSKGALSATLLKATDLGPSDNDKDNSCFVKISLMVAERVIKTKKTKSSKIKSPNSSAEWDEEFVFHIAPSLINQISLALTVCSRNSFGLTRIIGKTNTGPFMYATGQGLDHWNDMLASQKSAVAQWHLLN